MSIKTTALAVALALPIGPCLAWEAAGQNAYASASVDPHLFRDGEVRRRNERFGAWSLDCDEIVRLKQRFCSLRTLALDASGGALARLTISTDERGRPAALIDLPHGTDLRAPVVIEANTALVVGKPSAALAPAVEAMARASAKRRRGPAGAPALTSLLSATLWIGLCDAVNCQTVWPLAPAEIAALRAGAGLRVRFMASGRGATGFDLRTEPPSRPLLGVVSSEGFGEALQASLR